MIPLNETGTFVRPKRGIYCLNMAKKSDVEIYMTKYTLVKKNSKMPLKYHVPKQKMPLA